MELKGKTEKKEKMYKIFMKRIFKNERIFTIYMVLTLVGIVDLVTAFIIRIIMEKERWCIRTLRSYDTQIQTHVTCKYSWISR